MQLYRGLPIITNKIPVDERNGIPHHLMDFIGLEEEPWHINKFRNECLQQIREVHARGKLPILVGGTHYYTQSVLFHGALIGETIGSESPESSDQEEDSPTRREGWEILEAPPSVMLEKLREVDPIMAARWHPNEARKIRRSLEIYLKTGKPASQVYAEQHRQRQSPGDDDGDGGALTGRLRFPTLVLWVHSEREKLYQRLDGRVDAMMANGLVDEAKSMWNCLREKERRGRPVDTTRGIWVSIGFKELRPYFTALETDATDAEDIKESCVSSIKTSTRQYSSRQTKWIRTKLWTALADSHAKSHFFVLDGTDVSAWEQTVAGPSERLVHSFLSGERLPDPKTLSPLALETISEREREEAKRRGSADQHPVEKLRQITCDICKKTMTGQEQWEIHLRGRGHRRALAGIERRAKRDEYFRQKEMAGS